MARPVINFGFGGDDEDDGGIVMINIARVGRRRGSSGSARLGPALASATPEADLGDEIEEIAAAANTNYALSAGLEIERPGIAGRSVYYLLRGGRRVGVRKVSKITTERAGHFVATQNELYIYNTLVDREGFASHVVPFRGGDETDSLIYLDFGLVPGATLHDMAPSHKKAALLLPHVVRSLIWLAEQGFTHGDIKADNFYVTASGHVLLLDFGLTKRMGPAMASQDRTAFVAMAKPMLRPALGTALQRLLDATPYGTNQVEFYRRVIQILRPRQTTARRRHHGRKSRRR